jgi:hypothetical protein
MELLKVHEGRQIFLDRNQAPNWFTVSQQESSELAPGYWTSPSDSVKLSLYPTEGEDFTKAKRKADWEKTACIIVSDPSEEFLTKAINLIKSK